MNLNRIIAFLFCFHGAVATQAQALRQLPLSEAIELGVKNSKNLKISDARIEIAGADLRAAKDRQLPDVNISGSYLRLGNANVDLKGRNGNGDGPVVNQALYGIANVSYPIYAGGRIKYGIESAKFLEEAAQQNAANDREGVVFSIIQAYTNLYKASKSVAVIEQNLRASAQRDSSFSRLEANGLLARNDLLKSQLQTSNIELTLLEAKNNYDIAMVNTDLLLGLPETTMIEADNSFLATAPLPSYEQMQTAALMGRKDVQAIDLQRKAAGLGIRSAKASAYPELALTGGYVAADIPKLITITNAVNIGLGVRYNLASLWKTNTSLKQAVAQESEIIAMRDLLTDRIKSDLNRDYRNYLLTQKKSEVFEKAILQATENARITKNKYDNSLVTITELLEADVLLLQANLNAAAGRGDAALAYNKLLATTGTLVK